LPKRELTPSSLLSFLETGGTHREAAAAFKVSLPTIQKTIAELQSSEEVLNIYKGLQPLHITALQVELLSRVTSDRLDEADLDTLMRAFNVLKKVELQSEESRQREKVTGLVAYLLELEKEERIKRKIESGDIVDITPADTVSDTNVHLDPTDKKTLLLHSLIGTNTMDKDEDELEEGLLDSLP
jgi:hypothetical protein